MPNTSTNPDVLEQITGSLSLLFSVLMLTGINIAISGHLLGFVFNLETSGRDHFTLRIPFILHLKITGRQVAAGFAAFSLPLLVVGLFLHKAANEIFVMSMQATDKQWLACLALAACVSIITCLFLGAIRMIWLMFDLWRENRKKPPGPSPEERVQKLIS